MTHFSVRNLAVLATAGALTAAAWAGVISADHPTSATPVSVPVETVVTANASVSTPIPAAEAPVVVAAPAPTTAPSPATTAAPSVKKAAKIPATTVASKAAADDVEIGTACVIEAGKAPVGCD